MLRFTIYSKHAGQKTFKITDWSNGTQVANKIHATVIDECRLTLAKDVLKSSLKINPPGLILQIRSLDGKKVIETFEA